MLMSPCGYTRLSRAGARHGSSAASTGSQSPDVGFRYRRFSFASDCGLPSAVARTGKDDPKATSTVP